MGSIKGDTRSIDNGSCIPSGLPEPARWLLGSQLPGARLYHTAHLSNVFWWLKPVGLYSLYRIQHPKRRIGSYSLMGTIVSPNKIYSFLLRPAAAHLLFSSGKHGVGFGWENHPSEHSLQRV